MMEQNVGMVDRYVRITLGSLLVATGAARMARRHVSTGGMGLGLLGGMMLAEGVLGTCALYSLLGINTKDDQLPAGKGGSTGAADAQSTDGMEPGLGI